MNKLIFGSCMAPNADDFVRDLLKYIEQVLDLSIEVADWMTWPEREAALDRGRIALAWICGLPYTWKADEQPPTVRLLAAPVMSGERYRDQAVYFSDVVVRRESSFQSFMDLKGSVWGYNEPRSHSGYNLVRYELARRGLQGSFFQRTVETGSHQQSLEAILRGEIDAAAIDSTVLETELRLRPGLGAALRAIETFGPSPMPPIVAAAGLDPALGVQIRDTLLRIHQSDTGRAMLERHHVARFAPVDDRSYDPIREMDRIAQSINL